jgi:hypothetical protein
MVVNIKRTVFNGVGGNWASVSYTDRSTGERITRKFYASSGGGYVYEQSRYGTSNDRQVCSYLDSTGATLYYSGKGDLVDDIRREYKRMRRREEVIARMVGWPDWLVARKMKQYGFR